MHLHMHLHCVSECICNADQNARKGKERKVKEKKGEVLRFCFLFLKMRQPMKPTHTKNQKKEN